jgi:hypothetical protein
MLLTYNQLTQLDKKEKNKIHLVFTRLFNYFGRMFEFKNALFHYYLPFTYFLGQVIHFINLTR